MTSMMPLVDAPDYLLPDPVRQAMATAMGDTSTPEGEAVANAALAATAGAYVPATESALRGFFRTLALRGDDNVAGPVKIHMVGDSTTEGVGVTTTHDRMLDRFGGFMCRRFSPITTRYGQYIASTHISPVDLTDWPVVQTGTITQDVTRGLGLRGVIMTSVASQTYTVTGRWAHLFYLTYPGYGSFTYSVDGGAATTVSTDAAENNGANVSIDMGNDNQHTITVSWAAGQVRFFGVRQWAQDAQIHVYDGGHAGAVTSQFADQASYGHWQQVAAMGADLIVISLGLNDYFQKGAGAFQSELTAAVTNAKSSAPTASILLAAAPTPQGGTAHSDPWSTFVSIMQTVATAEGTAFTDYGQRIGTHDADTLGLFFDFTHLNRFGQAIEADALAGYLSPR
jgi:lysophospholipase L1-like esterase